MLANSSEALIKLNKLMQFFGFYLPLNDQKPNRCLVRKVTGINAVFYTITLLILLKTRDSVVEIEQDKALTWILLIIQILACLLITIRRYLQIDTLYSMFFHLESLRQHLITPTNEASVKLFLKGNYCFIMKFLSMFIIMLTKTITLYFLYGANCTGYVLELIFILFLVYETYCIETVLGTVKSLTALTKSQLLESITEIYKCPVSEVTKADNGDLIILGWIKTAIDFRKDQSDCDLIRAVTVCTFTIIQIINTFNRTLSFSFILILILNIQKLISLILTYRMDLSLWQTVNVFEDSALLIISLVSLGNILVTCDNITHSLGQIANNAFKYLIDIPTHTFLTKEREVKLELKFLSNFLLQINCQFEAISLIVLNKQFHFKLVFLFVFIAWIIHLIEQAH